MRKQNIRTKIETSCFYCFYLEDEGKDRYCLERCEFVMAFNCCDEWKPKIRFLLQYEMPKFVKYDKFKLDRKY